jgi:hypothetical protein
MAGFYNHPIAISEGDIARLAEEAVDITMEEARMADRLQPSTSSTPKPQTYEYYMQNLGTLIYTGAHLTVMQVGLWGEEMPFLSLGCRCLYECCEN